MSVSFALRRACQRVIGDALRTRTDRHRMTEAALAVDVLFGMPVFGRPVSVRIASSRTRKGLLRPSL